jgi:hypothetical protein
MYQSSLSRVRRVKTTRGQKSPVAAGIMVNSLVQVYSVSRRLDVATRLSLISNILFIQRHDDFGYGE